MVNKANRRNLPSDKTRSICSHHRNDHGAISDHLCDHVHLTNCIHSKNHMNCHSSHIAERSFIQDLILLQKSRSLRDPSMSPPSWLSPSIVVSHATQGRVRNSPIQSGKRSINIEKRKELGLFGTSVPAAGSEVAKGDMAQETSSSDDEQPVTAAEGTGDDHKFPSVKHNSYESFSNHGKGEGKMPQTSNHAQTDRPKTRYGQLEEVASQMGSLSKKFCESRQTIRNADKKGIPRRPQSRITGGCGEPNTVQNLFDNRFDIREDVLVSNSRCAASTNVPESSASQWAFIANEQTVNSEPDTAQPSRNECGISWNWSRIHQGSRNLLDKAGRSLPCGLSDPRLRKVDGSTTEGELNVTNMPISTGQLSSGSPDSEVLPLLTEASDSQASGADRYHSQDYSGELDIFSNHSLKCERESDLLSDARSNFQRISRAYPHRHRSLTQKYKPKTFKDIVGQNLVAQALFNAVCRGKIGLIYVFYGAQGTGKTSCARVFAKALNCHSIDHPRPCNVCSSCISHNSGRNMDVIEVGQVRNYDFESIMDAFANGLLSPRLSQYIVFIIDDSDTLPPNLWSVISKFVDQAPRNVVFVLVSLNLDHLPHNIISRCQKFFFPKLKDSDIISTLQWISSSEGMEIDKDALKLIASRSNGSLRDAEMILDQLTLLGKKISFSLVQELVGLVPNEKLVDLLDLALSADAASIVKSLREIIESGVDPHALMSQLATLITDILAGSYVFTPGKPWRKFFQHSTLSMADMEKLRQALQTLCEAEKQLRVSSDKLTWLTAALLQIAPDQQYLRLSSMTNRGINNSPLPLNNYVIGGMHSSTYDQFPAADNGVLRSDEPDKVKIWRAVLEAIRSDSLRQFLYHEGKLKSVVLGAAPTVQLSLRSNKSKSMAEKFRGQILEAFESVLASTVTLEIRCESKHNLQSDASNVHSMMTLKKEGEIIETDSLGDDPAHVEPNRTERKGAEESHCNKRIVASKTSLGHVIHLAENLQQGARSKREAVSIAEQLEKENLRMGPRARSLLCWKVSRKTRAKLSKLRIKTRRPRSLMRLVALGRCLLPRSRRQN